MDPSKISPYLFTNILTIGISSFTPMVYLSMDTIKCPSNADPTKDVWSQCSGVSTPQLSICVFLLLMMIIKVVVAPLSITIITANDLIKLNLPHCLIFQGFLFSLSFLLNLYLLANIEEGEGPDGIETVAWAAIFLSIIPASLELFHMTLHHAHRTSHALSPTVTLSHSPTEGSAIAGFV